LLDAHGRFRAVDWLDAHLLDEPSPNSRLQNSLHRVTGTVMTFPPTFRASFAASAAENALILLPLSSLTKNLIRITSDLVVFSRA
jgi:hypothetical protein